jgi:hypothetical protein
VELPPVWEKVTPIDLSEPRKPCSGTLQGTAIDLLDKLPPRRPEIERAEGAILIGARGADSVSLFSIPEGAAWIQEDRFVMRRPYPVVVMERTAEERKDLVIFDREPVAEEWLLDAHGFEAVGW